MVFQAYMPRPLRRRFRGLGDDIPTYLDPASADLPVSPFVAPDSSPAAADVVASAPTTSFWDTITSTAGDLLKTGVQAGAQIASAALMKQYVAAKGPPPPGYTYSPQGQLVKSTAAAKKASIFGGTSPIMLLAVGAIGVVAYFTFGRRGRR